jgi:hypothetical protein
MRLELYLIERALHCELSFRYPAKSDGRSEPVPPSSATLRSLCYLLGRFCSLGADDGGCSWRWSFSMAFRSQPHHQCILGRPCHNREDKLIGVPEVVLV